ncbi:MAG: carbohydrate kinase family protein [Rhodospirillaceae bacterium]|nr:carbohydrate kinase family protein [Rhodospirillaceae bacterium]
MSALICGSIAYDNIMVFEDSFKNHILPDQIHILNVSFLVPRLRREFGGCALNIAYNLKLLGAPAIPMGTAGRDFAPYQAWLDEHGIRQDHITVINDVFTAQAYITTDLDDNQIIAFHPGAMNHSHLNKVGDARGVTIGIVSPDGRSGMLEHASQFAAADIPFIFDPGQGLPMFDGEELRRFVEQASWIAVNDYEWALLNERTGWDADAVKRRVGALIVTRGAQGSMIYTEDGDFEIPAAQPAVVADPTGCGDAYRAGLLLGLMRGLDWPTVGRIASLMGAVKIECHGTQNHSFSMEDFERRFEHSFGRPIE